MTRLLAAALVLLTACSTPKHIQTTPVKPAVASELPKPWMVLMQCKCTAGTVACPCKTFNSGLRMVADLYERARRLEIERAESTVNATADVKELEGSLYAARQDTRDEKARRPWLVGAGALAGALLTVMLTGLVSK